MYDRPSAPRIDADEIRLSRPDTRWFEVFLSAIAIAMLYIVPY